MPMAIKLGSVMTYLEELLPIKSHDPLIKWSCEITCDLVRSQYLWPLNLVGW